MSVSFSRLKVWEQCGERALRNREGKAAPKDGRIFLAGTVADRAMRRYLEQDDPQPGTICDPVDELLHHYIHEDEEYVIRWKGDVATDRARVKAKVIKVLTLLEPTLWEKVIPQGYQAEVRFRQTVGIPYLDGSIVPIDLIGGMDILCKSLDGEDKYAVYDLKATEDDSYVRGAILAQLIFYSIAVRAMFGKYPSEVAYFTPACKERVVPLEVNAVHVSQMMARIVKYAQGVWREEWQPKEVVDSSCHYCEVRHACSLWSLPSGEPVSFEAMAAKRRSKK